MPTLDSYDQFFVAFAVCRGAGLVFVDKPDPTSTFLMFHLDDSTHQASRALAEWRSSQCYVNAKSYASALRFVKRALRTAASTASKDYGENNGNGTAH